MTELSKTEILAFQSQLLAHRETLRDSTASLNESSEIVELDQARQGRLSRMDALQAQAMSKAMQERCQQQLKEINLALKRIEHADFGYCQCCDALIARARISINPAVRFCINCAD